MMHPWKTKHIPDLGKILYRQVSTICRFIQYYHCTIERVYFRIFTWS